MEGLLSIIFLSIIWYQSSAFAPASSLSRNLPTITSNDLYPNVIKLSAKRRRRKDASQPSSDELPDFDIDEDAPVETIKIKQPKAASVAASPPRRVKSSNPTPIKRGSGLNSQLAEELGGNVEGLDEDLILSAMRGQGDAWQPPRSIEDTLRDRSLEKFMNFDKQIAVDGRSGETVDLPTMEEVINKRRKREAAEAVQEGRVQDAAMLIDTEGMGKKAAKRAERKAAAMQRVDETEGSGFSLEGLNVLKLLENGAWVGIGLLVVWEIYINSPLFERAAPLIPAVFD
jgi:hypothetical protein